MAFIPVTPPTSSNNECLTCTSTRSISVSFTAASPAPANGYIVKWKKVSEPISSFVQVIPNPTASPVTINNVPACDDIDVVVQASCGPGFSSQEVTAVATGLGVALKCGCGYQGDIDNMNFYIYPSIPIDFTGIQNGSTITLAYDSISRINRFEIYNVTDSTITVSSGWAGLANYPGPWGASNNTPTTGDITFIYDNTKTYVLNVQVGGADPNNQTNDAWSVVLGCTYVAPPPTYYYYQGTLCSGTTTETFRSTVNNLHTLNVVVKANATSMNNTVQCFNQITNNAQVNTNDVIDTFANCFICNGNAAYVPITNFYNPCTLSATGGITDADIYLPNGTVDVALGVTLLTSTGAAHTTVSLIASSNGEIFNVNEFGQVVSSTNQFC
jgi:hypothetical protein